MKSNSSNYRSFEKHKIFYDVESEDNSEIGEHSSSDSESNVEISNDNSIFPTRRSSRPSNS